MTLLKELFGSQINEIAQPVDPTLALEDQLEILEQRLAAAKRGLGFANKLKNPMQKKKHMALTLGNLNRIRASLNKVIDAVSQFDRAEHSNNTEIQQKPAWRGAWDSGGDIDNEANSLGSM